MLENKKVEEMICVCFFIQLLYVFNNDFPKMGIYLPFGVLCHSQGRRKGGEARAFLRALTKVCAACAVVRPATQIHSRSVKRTASG